MAISERDMTETQTTGLFAKLDRKELLKALTATKVTVSGARHVLPVTTNARLTVRQGTVSLATTNLDAAMTVELNAMAQYTTCQPTDGACMADHKQLLAAVKALKSTTVELSHDGALLNVRGDAAMIPVSSLFTVDDFPIVPTDLHGQSFMLETSDLVSIAAAIPSYAATDDTRPILTGALFRIDGNRIEVAAADGFRLATRTVEGLSDTGFTFILPASTLKLCKHLPLGSVAYVALSETRNQCEIQSGTVRILSRLIEGSYPNLKQIIPTKFAGVFDVRRAELAHLVAMVLPAVKDNSNAITFAFDQSLQKLTVSGGSAEERRTVEVHTYLTDARGESITVQFNGTYIKQACDTIDGELLQWSVSGPNSAAVIRPVDGAEHTVVIMPMHNGAR